MKHSTRFPQNHVIIQYVKKLWRTLSTYFLPPKSEEMDVQSDLTRQLTQGRDRILTFMLRVVSVLSILILLYLMGDLLARERWELVAVYLIVAVAIGLISYLRRIAYHLRAITFLIIVYLIGIVDLAFFGIAEDWRLYLSAFAILATVFLGWRAGMIALFLSLAAFITLAWQIAQKNIIITASTLGSPIPTAENIVAMSLAFILTNAIIIAAITTLLNEFEKATKKEHKAAVSLGQKTTELERSLSREKQLAQELAFTLQREEELSQLRSTIITTVSHEFRTPLTVINNSTNLLDKYYERLSHDKRQTQYERIRSAIFYLDNLLQDVSLVERTQKEDVHFQPGPIQFGALFAQLSSDLLQQTGNPANVHFQRNGDDKKRLIVDYNLLKRIVSNLLVNALKFSPPAAPITICLAVDKQLTITVTDQGIGIPATDKERVVELFQRGSNVEAQSGLGLGLFIVQQLLLMMSGTISLADNPEGQGTVFTIQVPISPID